MTFLNLILFLIDYGKNAIIFGNENNAPRPSITDNDDTKQHIMKICVLKEYVEPNQLMENITWTITILHFKLRFLQCHRLFNLDLDYKILDLGLFLHNFHFRKMCGTWASLPNLFSKIHFISIDIDFFR